MIFGRKTALGVVIFLGASACSKINPVIDSIASKKSSGNAVIGAAGLTAPQMDSVSTALVSSNINDYKIRLTSQALSAPKLTSISQSYKLSLGYVGFQ